MLQKFRIAKEKSKLKKYKVVSDREGKKYLIK